MDIVLDKEDLDEIETRLSQIEIKGERLSQTLLDDIVEDI